MIFRLEKDLRRWLAGEAASVWWFENRLGGSFGFPDAMVADDQGPVFLELKMIEGGFVGAHPAQLNTVRELRSAGLFAAFLGAERGGSDIWLFGPGVMERVTEGAVTGPRRRYKVKDATVFRGSSLHSIIKEIRWNDFPGSFGRGGG